MNVFGLRRETGVPEERPVSGNLLVTSIQKGQKARMCTYDLLHSTYKHLCFHLGISMMEHLSLFLLVTL